MPLEYAEGADRANLGCKPLGRGPIVSPVILAEIAALKAYGKDMAAVGPVNCHEAAVAMRKCLAKHMPRVKYIFRGLGLEH